MFKSNDGTEKAMHIAIDTAIIKEKGWIHSLNASFGYIKRSVDDCQNPKANLYFHRKDSTSFKV